METIKPIPLLLKEELLRRQSKNENYSLRAFARAMGLSSSFVSKVLSGKKNLSKKTALQIASRLGLDVDFHFWADGKNLDFEDIDFDNFQFIADWYHYAILELVTVTHFKSNISWIAESLGISEDKAEAAVARLIKLNLLKKDSRGKITDTGKNLTNRNQASLQAAHTEHERQLLKKALVALDETPVAERSQSSMTMAIPSSRMREAREKIKTFRREMMALLQRKGTRDSVYQLSVSLFPLTKTKQNQRSQK